jgi:hypothetical protein
MTDITSRLIVSRLPFFSLVDCRFVAQLVDFCEMAPILAIRALHRQFQLNDEQFLPEKITRLGVDSIVVEYVANF